MNSLLASVGVLATGEPPNPSSRPVTLLVFDDPDTTDWSALFKHSRLCDGRPIAVIHSSWSDCLVCSELHESGKTIALAHIRPRGGGRAHTIRPDFVLVRSEVRGATHTDDHRNALFGLMFANVPSVNTLSSIYSFLERPIVQAELNRICGTVGKGQFPVIAQTYFSSHREMMYGNSFPAVVKVGHAHAGFGKMRVRDHKDWEDFRSVCAMTDGKYVTAESFIEGAFDLRIQKIGAHYRCFKRTDVSGTWKTNTGTCILEHVELTAAYKRWVDLASDMFGGLDVCTVDVIVDRETGAEHILEVNGTSSGFSPDTAAEDNVHLRDLTLERMNAALC